MLDERTRFISFLAEMVEKYALKENGEEDDGCEDRQEKKGNVA